MQNENVINIFTKKPVTDTPFLNPDTDWEELIRKDTVDITQLVLYALRCEHNVTVPKELDPRENQFTKDMSFLSLAIKTLLEHYHGVGPSNSTVLMEHLQDKFLEGWKWKKF